MRISLSFYNKNFKGIPRIFFGINILFFILSTSCATILAGKKDDIKVYITSNVPEAKVYDSENRLLGTTPFYYLPIKTNEEQKLKVVKENYETQEIKITLKEKLGFVFLDALFLGIPYIYDKVNGAIYEADINSIAVFLPRIYSKTDEKLNVIFEDVEWKIDEGKSIGFDGDKPIFFKKSNISSFIYKNTLCETSNKSRVVGVNCDDDEVESNLLVHANTITIKPVINSMKIKSEYVKRKYVSSIDLNVTWLFNKRGDRTVLEVKDLIAFKGADLSLKSLIAQALKASLTNVASNDSLFKSLMDESKNNTDPISLFKKIELVTTQIPAFTKNKDLIQYLMKGVVTIKHNDGHGSGFFIDENGYLITNYHVIKGKTTVDVQLNESITLSAEIIRSDEVYDVALLKVNGKDFRALTLLNSDSALAGEDVFAIGTPADISLGQSVTKGIISGRRKIGEKVFIQTDVAINSGNSGGPLLNEDGKVIGMVTMKLVGGGVQGIGFCVPTNTILEVLNITLKDKP